MANVTVTIEAFGYEHNFTDGWNEQELEILTDAPVVCILSAEDSVLESFIATRNGGTPWYMPMDSMPFWSEAGECLVFGYEHFDEGQVQMLEMLGIEWNAQERD